MDVQRGGVGGILGWGVVRGGVTDMRGGNGETGDLRGRSEWRRLQCRPLLLQARSPKTLQDMHGLEIMVEMMKEDDQPAAGCVTWTIVRRGLGTVGPSLPSYLPQRRLYLEPLEAR